MGEPPLDADGTLPPRLMITPNPDGGPLVLKIKCYVDATHKRGRTHSVTVHEDWSITVPHDLEGERIAVAFGGYLSCLDLVDKVAPAAETYLRRQLRADLPQISRGLGARWYTKVRVDTCCAGTTSWATAREAAAHWRSARHVAAELGGHTTMLQKFGTTLLHARGLNEPLPAPAAPELVGTVVTNPRDLSDLWEAGLSPDLIGSLHNAVCATRPLPVSFYVGITTRRPNLDWIRATAERVPERADYVWLSWSEHPADLLDPGLRARWLRLGVPRTDVEDLTGSPYGPEEVRRLARALGRSSNTAAGLLARCVRADAFPELDALIDTCAKADPPPDVVTAAALHRLMTYIDLPATREQAALALITCGSPVVAADVIRTTGTLAPAALREGLSDWEQRRQGKATHRA
ncbi:MAG: hypothetical protein M3P04_12245 [Actinomycetota bacterium]|nr:hypothetical protein [Actinomycetota bacterium]